MFCEECQLKFKYSKICHFYKFDKNCIRGQKEFCKLIVTKRDELKCPYYICPQILNSSKVINLNISVLPVQNNSSNVSYQIVTKGNLNSSELINNVNKSISVTDIPSLSSSLSVEQNFSKFENNSKVNRDSNFFSNLSNDNVRKNVSKDNFILIKKFVTNKLNDSKNNTSYVKTSFPVIQEKKVENDSILIRKLLFPPILNLSSEVRNNSEKTFLNSSNKLNLKSSNRLNLNSSKKLNLNSSNKLKLNSSNNLNLNLSKNLNFNSSNKLNFQSASYFNQTKVFNSSLLSFKDKKVKVNLNNIIKKDLNLKQQFVNASSIVNKTLSKQTISKNKSVQKDFEITTNFSNLSNVENPHSFIDETKHWEEVTKLSNITKLQELERKLHKIKASQLVVANQDLDYESKNWQKVKEISNFTNSTKVEKNKFTNYFLKRSRKPKEIMEVNCTTKACTMEFREQAVVSIPIVIITFLNHS